MTRIKSAVVVVLAALMSGVPVEAQRPEQSGFVSFAMGLGCPQAEMASGAIFAHAKDLTKGFVPQPDVPVLWSLTNVGERVMRVESALHGIRTGCIEFKAGRATAQYTDRLLSNQEEAIRDVLDGFARDVMFAAVGGQVAQVPAIRRGLESLVGATRQSALMGETELAEHGRARMMDALRAFTTAFRQNCYDQSFDPEFALSITPRHVSGARIVSIE